MKTTGKAFALVAVLALAGCGNTNDPGAASTDNSGKSPLAEYMGDGFKMNPGGGTQMISRAGGQGSSEEELAKQRQVEDKTAACMQAAGFRYVAVPPESNPKSKFDEAFNLPPDKFAEQYGYGISTIDWAKPAADSSNPNTAIRNALSATAKKAYDKALSGQFADGNGAIAVPADGKGDVSKLDRGCRGKAADEVYGSASQNKLDEFSKYESLFKDIEALSKRITADQRVVDATAAWSDCLADAGHAGFKKPEEARQKVQQKLDQLTGQNNTTKQPGRATFSGPPSFDKVDSQKLADLRKFEIELAKADQACKAKGYDEAYKKAQYELEKEFVAANKAELEAYRDAMAQR
jgi:hypothetical protein